MNKNPIIEKFATKNFRQRVLSILVIGPVALLAIYAGDWIYSLFVTAVVTLGMREWLRLVDPKTHRAVVLFAYTALLVVMGCGAWLSPAFGAMLGMVFILVLFLVAARYHEERAGWIALGIPYMGFSGLALIYLRITPVVGMDLAYYLIATVWATDIGAYLAGRLIGGPKLAPDISPSKTWAGLFGGMALAALFGYGVGIVCNIRHTEIAASLAVILAGVSQLGDLFESYFKRRSGVKESGGLIPGHGGILDRIDGLVFAAIFFVLFQIALGPRLQWW